MLKQFLQTEVTIKRETDKIYEGPVKEDIDFDQIESAAFLSISVSAATCLSISVRGEREGESVFEVIEITGTEGNRGFQEFDVIDSIKCSGVLTGEIKISTIGEESEPLLMQKVVGTSIIADRSYKPEYHDLVASGESDLLRRGFKFYFLPSVNLKEGDIIEVGRDSYRVESVIPLKSLTGQESHLEATVKKFPSKRLFD